MNKDYYQNHLEAVASIIKERDRLLDVLREFVNAYNDGGIGWLNNALTNAENLLNDYDVED